jgi:hypothetical protein
MGEISSQPVTTAIEPSPGEPRERTAASMVYLWTALGPEINQVYVYLAPTETRSGDVRRGPARLNRKR